MRGAGRGREQLEDLADRRRLGRHRILDAELLRRAREVVDRARDLEQAIALAGDHAVPLDERLGVGRGQLVGLASDERARGRDVPRQVPARDLAGHEAELQVAVADQREDRTQLGGWLGMRRLVLRRRRRRLVQRDTIAGRALRDVHELRLDAVLAGERVRGRVLPRIRVLERELLRDPEQRRSRREQVRVERRVGLAVVIGHGPQRRRDLLGRRVAGLGGAHPVPQLRIPRAFPRELRRPQAGCFALRLRCGLGVRWLDREHTRRAHRRADVAVDGHRVDQRAWADRAVARRATGGRDLEIARAEPMHRRHDCDLQRLRDREPQRRRPHVGRWQHRADRARRVARVEDLVELRERDEVADVGLELHQQLAHERLLVRPGQPRVRIRKGDGARVIADDVPDMGLVAGEIELHHAPLLRRIWRSSVGLALDRSGSGRAERGAGAQLPGQRLLARARHGGAATHAGRLDEARSSWLALECATHVRRFSAFCALERCSDSNGVEAAMARTSSTIVDRASSSIHRRHRTGFGVDASTTPAMAVAALCHVHRFSVAPRATSTSAQDAGDPVALVSDETKLCHR